MIQLTENTKRTYQREFGVNRKQMGMAPAAAKVNALLTIADEQ
jgi:hypothetical protein